MSPAGRPGLFAPAGAVVGPVATGAVVASGTVLVSYIAIAHGFRTIHAWHAAVTLVSTAAFAWGVARARVDRVRIALLLAKERRLSREDALTALA